MKVTELTIGRRPSYHDKANQLFGEVKIEGEEGSQTISLSYGAIHRIFRVIATDAAERAQINAREATRALQDAMDEPMVLENDGHLQIETL